MLKIKASEVKALGYDFVKAVDEYVAALTAHTKEVGTSAPGAPDSLVERAVFRAKAPGRADVFVANFEIEDDSPPPPAPSTLAQKKDALEQSLRASTAEMANAVSPVRKQMMLHMQLNAVNSTPPEKRTAEQVATLGLVAEMTKRLDVINWYLAEQLHALDDLTDANVDAWHPAPPPQI